MHMLSTRGGTSVPAAFSIVRGLADDGGLYVPESFPRLPESWQRDWLEYPYAARASAVLASYLEQYDDIQAICEASYGDRFTDARIAPVRSLDAKTHLLELFHGPTLAFKDMALQILPRLLKRGMEIEGISSEALILVATSGDTGKAALEGFRDVPGTRVVVYYPAHGVSALQELQMQTQEGANVAVVAVDGNFDDAQTGVKRIFSDARLADKLAWRGMAFSSANSINWGRLVPQIAYYVSAYLDLLHTGAVRAGELIHACVPTGNFGNILAAYYARLMGVPIDKLICASNRNHVLADFIATGRYDRNRAFYTTASPSMDILISSNLERLLFELAGREPDAVRGWMDGLRREGVFELGGDLHDALTSRFIGGWCSDEQAARVIGTTWRERGALLDPHTAVAVHVLDAYRERTGDATPALVVGTASPYKFPGFVLSALGEAAPEADGLEACDRLSGVTGIPIPAPIAALRGLSARTPVHSTPGGMEAALFEALDGLR